jgi:succinyl-CoA synthetase beta subunit
LRSASSRADQPGRRLFPEPLQGLHRNRRLAVEINPFITTKDDKLFALDAKITFDDNALFRHPEIKALRDTAEEDPLEVEASKYALNYIKLDGSIACMVNGAGLAMATMDIIQYAGGSPANFLDVGGGATQEQIEHAFEILLSDSNVKAIFINIFGGILRVDRLATGVVAAARNLNVRCPSSCASKAQMLKKAARFSRSRG